MSHRLGFSAKVTAVFAATVIIITTAIRADEAPADKDDYVNRIYIANPDGSNMKPLVNLPEYKSQGSPSWSKDGKLIAFDAIRPQMGENLNDSMVIVVNADGANPRVLGDGCMPNFSPKANRLAYSRYKENWGVWVMNVDDGTSFSISKEGWGAQWSPDGTRILYATVAGKPNLVVLDIVEGTTEPLFEAGDIPYRSFTWNFKWSPDGRKIVFRGERSNGKVEVGIVDARGAKHGLTTRFVGDVRSNFAWRPDSKRIFFAYQKGGPDSPSQLFSVDPDTNDEPERLAGQDSARSNSCGWFSPDGKKLVMGAGKFTPPKK